MRNPLTFRVESLVGSLFILLLTGFLLSAMFIVKRNFDSETEILNSSTPAIQLRSISAPEKALISKWLDENGIVAPTDKNKFRYAVQQYPDRPWLGQ